MKGRQSSLQVRKYLASVYLLQGYAAAKPLAIKYGYAPRYLSHLTRDIMGHYQTIFYKDNPFVEFESYRFDPRFAMPIRTTVVRQSEAA